MTEAAYHLTIHDMPTDERPRERLRIYGADALSNAELLAILLRVGIKGENVLSLSVRILSENQGLLGLGRLSFDELSGIKGIGPAKASQVKAALELGKRMTQASPEQRPQITSPSDAANLLMADMTLLDQEHLIVLLLDTKNYVVKKQTVYIGNANSAMIRVAEIFKPAIKANCPNLIIAHNHPSGDPTPSPEDVQVTRRIAEAGHLLDIQLLDHIIIGGQRYISLKERGLGF